MDVCVHFSARTTTMSDNDRVYYGKMMLRYSPKQSCSYIELSFYNWASWK